MSKTKPVTVHSITCSKGHTFYPRVMPTGIVKLPDKCIIRNCRVYLDHKRVQKGLQKRRLNLHRPVKAKPVLKTRVINIVERPICLICNVTFFDEKNFEQHNKRMHQQR